MNGITDIRMTAQQLTVPQFDQVRELVSWMGAVQAQDYTMVKWALGMRLKSADIKKVEDALSKGEILRTHVMRPTWHIVAAEDIRWMTALSAKKIQSGMASWGKGFELSEELYSKTNDLIIKILEGNKSLTKKEIGEEFEKLTNGKLTADDPRLSLFLSRAETEGIVCSGIDRGRYQTYALIDERVPPTPELTKDEALAKLALSYFRSHSPATLEDFIWWSGLSITEAKHAVHLIHDKLISEKFEEEKLYIHESYTDIHTPEDVFHLLPPYDEYLISYKSRTHCLPLHHYPKAFTNYGIFYPVILHNGHIVGNWKKANSKGKTTIETDFFEKKTKVKKALINKAVQKHISFLQSSR